MATKININNYELFAIDYIEGNLNTYDKSEFERFLKNNPKIKEEISDFGDFSFNEDEIIFENKNKLKKSPIEGLSYNEYLIISDIEKEISTNEKQDLKLAFENNQQTANEYNSFKKSILNKEKNNFENKTNLKKSPIEKLSYSEYLMISAIENTISKNEKKELNELTKNNSSEYDLYKKTKLQAEKITYPNKQSLKRTNIVTFKTARNIITAIAAMIILFFGVKTLFFNDEFSPINSATIALDNTSIIDYSIKRSNKIIDNDIFIDETNYTEPSNNYQNNQDFYVDNNQVDSQTFFIDTNYQQIAFDYDLQTRNSNYQLTNLPTNATYNYASNKSNYTYDDNKINIQPDEIVNFVFDKFQKITESDRNIKVDFDKKNKCYGIEYNDKSYSICLK